jgi:hypothetical protein
MRDKASIDRLAEVSVSGVFVDDFYAYMPSTLFLYTPSRELWPASSVNARVPPIPGASGKGIPASTWIAQHRTVEQMTWCPGLPMIVRNQLISEGGWIEHYGVSCFCIEPRSLG